MHHYSPSQIAMWIDCPRKWGWRYIDKIESSPNASADWGTRAHAMLEKWLRDGEPLDHVTDPDMAARVTTALEFLPEPGQCIPEIAFEYVTDGGIKWTGRIDYLMIKGGAVLVGDHKTTADVMKWGKSAEDLANDFQTVIYANTIFRCWTSLEQVELQWEYIQSKGAKLTKPVFLVMTRDEVEVKFAEIETIAKTIDGVRKHVTTAAQLPYNTASCSKYGGCPYQHKCNLSPQEFLRSIF